MNRKNFNSSLHQFFAKFVGRKTAHARLRAQYYREFRKHHPQLHTDLAWRQSSLQGLHNESGFIFGHVANQIKALKPTSTNRRILLAGEDARAKITYMELLDIPIEQAITSGLHDNTDVYWNFETAAPTQLKDFGFIVSHAIIEHLIDPYKHVCELIRLLAPGGHLIIYTVIPGFPYHRYPVDCLRFFPDWFMEVAKRNNVEVQDLYVGEDHIVCTMRKP